MVKTISEINEYSGETINPMNFPDQQFELYSVPSFETGFPEIVYGKEIGSSKQKVQKDDVLICKINPRINRVWKVAQYTDKPLIASSEWIVIRNSTIDSDYLCWYFSSEGFRKLLTSQVAGIGGSLTRAQPKQVKQYKVPIPDYDSQKHIATMLNKISDLIVLRKQQLDKLDELVKARFVEMFGDSKTNPKHWTTKTLETIAFVGSSKRVFVEELQDEGIPFYRGTEIGALATGENVVPELYITKEHYFKLCAASGTPKRGDLLMPSICPDGRIWRVDTDKPFYFKDGRVLWVHPTDNAVESTYLLYALKVKIISDYINIASGTTFAELKIFALKKLEVMIPPVSLQKTFSDLMQTICTERLTMQQGLDKMEAMKKALMQKFFGRNME